MMEKIRKDLSLPPEILILPDNLYQCAKCLGLSASNFVGSGRRRKLGFALNREGYIDQVESLISRAIFYYFHARIDDVQNNDPLRDNEVRRLIDLQLPSLIAVAPTNERFSRSRALEEAIVQGEKKAPSGLGNHRKEDRETARSRSFNIAPTGSARVANGVLFVGTDELCHRVAQDEGKENARVPRTRIHRLGSRLWVRSPLVQRPLQLQSFSARFYR